MHPRTLEEHLFENCISTEGDDIDDEDFRIRISFTLFEKPVENDDKDLNASGAAGGGGSGKKKTAWQLIEEGGHKMKEGDGKLQKAVRDRMGTGKVNLETIHDRRHGLGGIRKFALKLRKMHLFNYILMPPLIKNLWVGNFSRS